MMALISLASMPNWIWYTLIALLGAGVGGYLIHLIYTLPYQMMLEWQAEMIQVLNPIILDNAQDELLTGFGSSYHQKVAPVYLYAIMIPLSAFLSVSTLAIQGISIIGALSVIFVWFGLGLAGIDYRVQLLPDRLVLPLGMIGLMANGFGILTTPSDAIFGAVVGFLVLWLINALYRLVHRQDGMGLGDAKLLSACGAWLGVWQLPVIVFIAAALGVVAGIIIQRHQGKASAFAFGPYLIMAAWVVLLFGEYIQAYVGIR